jgi:hypothetical protein
VKFFDESPFISIICILFCSTAIAHPNQIKFTKIDSQNKGFADLLLIEKTDMTISVKLNGAKIVRYEVARTHSGTTATVKYSRLGNNLSLNYSFATTARYFYNENTCIKKGSNSFSISSLGSLLNATESTGIQYDETCQNQSELKKQISENLDSLIDKKNQKSITECIDQYDNTAAQKWMLLPTSLVKISCDDTGVKYSGVFDSQKKMIRISDKCLEKPAELSSVLKEEILHSFGVTNEHLAKCLATCPQSSSLECKTFNLKKIKIDADSGDQHTKLSITAPDGSMALNVTEDYNSAKTIEVPREIAVAQVPQPTVADLKMSQSVETMTVTDTPAAPAAASAGAVSSGGGASGATASSSGRSYSVASYPNSMMQFAATAVLPEKAFAQGTSSANAGGTPLARSPRSSASSSEALRHTAASRLPASDSALTDPNYSKTANTAVASSEISDESITSSNEVGRSSSVNALHSVNSRAGNAGGTPTAASDGDAGGHSGASGTGAVGSLTGGGANSAGRQASGRTGGSTKSAAGSRSPASLGGLNGGSGSATPTNLVQYFQTAPYSEIKQRLRDPKFIRDLQKNSTTVFDAQGHRFGASQGQVIFSDKGNRFVKEK